MNHILRTCGLKGYVKGEIQRPDPTIDSNGANNWAFNDNYAKDVIGNNVGPSQMVHVGRCATAHERSLPTRYPLLGRLHSTLRSKIRPR
jgi:hypothetical protein